MFRQILESLRRMKYRILTFGDYGRVLNRCAQVEQYLLDCANGKRTLPSQAECRKWARILGGN